jgi:hypothetical protein
MAEVDILDARKAYGGVQVLHGVSVDIANTDLGYGWVP